MEDNNLKKGFYSAAYFLKTAKILREKQPENFVTMQFFQRQDGVTLAGISDVIRMLKKAVYNPEFLEIYALQDGDIINANEPVLKIKGPYYQFGHFEGIIDGILSRQSSIATNCRKVLEAASDKEVIYMNDRSDYYYNQENDGYAAYIGGIRNFVTQAQVSKLPERLTPMGTVPHALIQAYRGDLVAALADYIDTFPKDKFVALVDYHNDVINETLKVVKQFKDRLFAVRVDTSSALIDKYFDDKLDQYEESEIRGVNKHLIRALRHTLDKNDCQKVKIIVSSGFNVEKITEFEKEMVPVDYYGVGQVLSKLTVNYTGDSVQVNGVNEAKFGRQNIASKRLKKIKI